MITKTDFNKIKPFEKDFHRAVKGNYKLPTPIGQDDIVLDILLKYEPQTRVNRGCGNCMLNIYKRLGWLYFAAKEAFEKAEAEKKAKKESKK